MDYKEMLKQARSRGKTEDLKMTQDEFKNLESAMEKPEFMSLLDEYMKEISDPKNKAETEAYLEQLERDNMMNLPEGSQLLKPTAAFCVKVKQDNGTKIFINMSQSELVDVMTTSEAKKGQGQGKNVSIPYVLSKPRPFKDVNGTNSVAFDCIFNNNTITATAIDERIRELCIGSAVEGVEKHLKVTCEKKWIVLKNNKFKGGKPEMLTLSGEATKNLKPNPKAGNSAPKPSTAAGNVPSSLSKLASGLGIKDTKKKTTNNNAKPSASSSTAAFKAAVTPVPAPENNGDGRKTPTYKIVQRGEGDMSGDGFGLGREKLVRDVPKELVVTVELPGLTSVKDVELDITTQQLLLSHPEFLLDLKLPYTVDEERGGAKFNKKKAALIVTLPVVVDTKAEDEARATALAASKKEQEKRQAAWDAEEAERRRKEEAEAAQRAAAAKAEAERIQADNKAAQEKLAREKAEKAAAEAKRIQALMATEAAAEAEASKKFAEDLAAARADKEETVVAASPKIEEVAEGDEGDESGAAKKKKKNKKKKKKSASNKGDNKEESQKEADQKEEKSTGLLKKAGTPPNTTKHVHWAEGDALAVPQQEPEPEPSPKKVKKAPLKGGNLGQKKLDGGVLRPSLAFTQCEESLSCVLKVQNVKADSVRQTFSSSTLTLKFSTVMGQKYLLEVKLWDACVSNRVSVTVNTKNVVLFVPKQNKGEWPSLTLTPTSPFTSPKANTAPSSTPLDPEEISLTDAPSTSASKLVQEVEEEEEPAPVEAKVEEVEDDGEAGPELDDDLPPLPDLEFVGGAAGTSKAERSVASPTAAALSNELMFELD